MSFRLCQCWHGTRVRYDELCKVLLGLSVQLSPLVWYLLTCSGCCTVTYVGTCVILLYTKISASDRRLVRERVQKAWQMLFRYKRHSMIKQRLSRNETRFQRVEGATMPADVFTTDKERGHVELLRKLLQTASYQIRATSEMLEETRQARERKLLRHQ